jgi:hypothetical protein
MNDPLIEKIKTIVEGLSSPAYTFLYESYENANVIIESVKQTKTALLLSIDTGELNIKSNGLFEVPNFTLLFMKPMELQDLEINLLESTLYELKTDCIHFIRHAFDDKDITIGTKFTYGRKINFFDVNEAIFFITFTCELKQGLTVYPEC